MRTFRCVCRKIARALGISGQLLVVIVVVVVHRTTFMNISLGYIQGRYQHFEQSSIGFQVSVVAKGEFPTMVVDVELLLSSWC